MIGALLAAAIVTAAPAPGRESAPSSIKSAFNLSPIYAALFTEGREWTFRVESVAEHTDLDDPRARHGVVRDVKVTRATCRVTKVIRWATAIGSRIACMGALSGSQVEEAIPAAGRFLDGEWVATKAGLWQFPGLILDGPEPVLEAQQMEISASPREATKKSTVGDGGTFEQVRRERTTWCSTRTSWSGDEAGNTFCWAPTTGIRAGRRFFAGGEYLEVSFCLESSSCRLLLRR